MSKQDDAEDFKLLASYVAKVEHTPEDTNMEIVWVGGSTGPQSWAELLALFPPNEQEPLSKSRLVAIVNSGEYADGEIFVLMVPKALDLTEAYREYLAWCVGQGMDMPEFPQWLEQHRGATRPTSAEIEWFPEDQHPL